ncbi:MAG: HNH endonuclease [Patescibacteria group bacterium]|nr:HNH endonuclease [Patescibacteria group bacterium]
MIKKKEIEKDFTRDQGDDFYLVKGTKREHSVKIYKKISSWFLQCGCETGVSRSPWGLCRHGIATLINKFLKENNLELVEKDRKQKRAKNGYVLVYKPEHRYSETKKGWILEHRSVMEDFLKRKLKKGECVHHIDMNKKNNKIENLMLFKSHDDHMKFHTKIKQFGMTNPIRRQIKNRWKGITLNK